MTESRSNFAKKENIAAVCSTPKDGMIKHDVGEGTLIIPRNGIFTRVLRSGRVKNGDAIEIAQQH